MYPIRPIPVCPLCRSAEWHSVPIRIIPKPLVDELSLEDELNRVPMQVDEAKEDSVEEDLDYDARPNSTSPKLKFGIDNILNGSTTSMC
jgi:hypothetical protein